ncbi:hypothetical protein EGW08_007351 [Elysia chlorotica]|uniref:Strictosidine synthase conserved region domain-containing protein n=1 Tax=Elysia chlorotica TaxID=188477 RepID=A0A433TTJ7_ELYCH|nr:hypothetical protein EGW08_007351 [Elysia chlorotica]
MQGELVKRVWSKPVLVAFTAVLTIYLIPSPISPKPVRLSDHLPVLEGPLAANRNLQKVTKLFEGQILGPESFAAGHDGSIYTGSADGRIWRIKDNTLSYVARTGLDHPDCGTYALEPECGRPKGMKLDARGDLIVVDAYKGLLRVDLDSGRVETLLDSELGFNGSKFLFLNAMDILNNGTILISESSTKWERRDYRYEVIETNNLGRILAFDPETRKAWLVADELYLANGMTLTHDQSAILVAEMSLSRISKIFVTGSRAGERSVLVSNLPGYPDNIKQNSRGHYYVGLGSVRFVGSSPLGSFLDLVGPYPALKKIITKLVPAAMFDVFLPKHAILLEISDDGSIVTSHHDPGASTLPALSEAFQHGEDIYIGHFKIPFVGRVKNSDLHNEQS